MDEKVLITTEKKPFSKLAGLAFTYALVFFAILFMVAISVSAEGAFLGAFVYSLILFSLFLIIFAILNNSELTITDKRAYGKTPFGKRVDLPLDSISSVGTSAFFQRLSVATASGNLTFWCIENLDEFHSAMSKLLIARQNEVKKPVEIKQEVSQSNADELKKYKDLLDTGVITQEEFDAKKKQLLGL